MGEPEKVIASSEVRSLADSSDMGESTKVPPSPSSRSITESQNSGGSSAMKVSVDPKQLEDVARQSATPILRFYRFITSEYRLLFTLVFCLNSGGVVGFLYEWATHGTPSKTAAALATSINLVVSIVIREEHVVNLLYTIFASAPKSFPLWLRRRMGKIYHLGGLHSGCASAATFWFILLSIETSWRGPYHAEKIILLIIIYILDILLISMIVMAHPSIRAKLHNGFELIHRFAGWSALALLWTLTVLTSDIERSPIERLSKVLLVNPNMWLLAVATWSIIMTWLNCRKIKVQSEQLSTHALRIYFDYVTPSPGTTIRISSRPLFEWHAFATVADPKRDGFSLIISNAGDWTKKLINEPPKEIWARRTPTCGVLRIAPMFRSILLVATGSGIAPCLPVILAQKTRINLFWSTRDPLTTYGDDIGGIIKALGPNAYIHNTTTMGRPDTLPLVIQQYRDAGSEAVIVISNPKLTIKLVQDLEYLEIPAFGPIWDS